MNIRKNGLHYIDQSRIMSSSKWMLIADLHVEKSRIERMRSTLDWLKDQFQATKPNHVILLGDSLHTRNSVNVEALQEVKRLLDVFSEGYWKPHIHVLVGNHDMSDKYNRTVNSPSVLENLSKRIKVYSEIERVILDDKPVLFIPYHENQKEIKEFLIRDQRDGGDVKETSIFAHIALDGARVNGISNESNVVCQNSNLNLKDFVGYQRVFAGHFHHHAAYGNNFAYVGSPMMFTFGDVDQKERGYVLYDAKEDTWDLRVNPHAVHFVSMEYVDAIKDSFDKASVNDKSVRIILRDPSISEEDQNNLQKLLTDAKALSIRFERKFERVAMDTQEGEIDDNIEVMLERNIDLFVDKQNGSDTHKDRLKNYLKSHLETTSLDISHETFVGDLKRVKMHNFLGIEGTVEVDYSKLDRGIWIIQGENGAGKTTLSDAIAWGLFNELLRPISVKEIINLKTKKQKNSCCYVEIQFENGYLIRRTRLPTKMEVYLVKPDGTKVEKGTSSLMEKEIRSILRTDWSNFQRTVLLNSLNIGKLFTGAERDRTEVMEKILGFEIFDKLLEKITGISKEMYSDIRKLEDSRRSLTDKKTITNEMRSNILLNIENERKRLEDTERELVNEKRTMEKYTKECEELKNLVDGWIRKEKDSDEELGEIHLKQDRIRVNQSKITSNLKNWEVEVDAKKKEEKRLQHEIKVFKSKIEKLWKNVGQKADIKILTEEINRKLIHLDERSESKDLYNKELELIKTLEEIVEGKDRILLKTKNDHDKRIKRLTHAINIHKQQLTELVADQSSIDRELKSKLSGMEMEEKVVGELLEIERRLGGADRKIVVQVISDSEKISEDYPKLAKRIRREITDPLEEFKNENWDDKFDTDMKRKRTLFVEKNGKVPTYEDLEKMKGRSRELEKIDREMFMKWERTASKLKELETKIEQEEKELEESKEEYVVNCMEAGSSIKEKLLNQELTTNRRLQRDMREKELQKIEDMNEYRMKLKTLETIHDISFEESEKEKELLSINFTESEEVKKWKEEYNSLEVEWGRLFDKGDDVLNEMEEYASQAETAKEKYDNCMDKRRRAEMKKENLTGMIKEVNRSMENGKRQAESYRTTLEGMEKDMVKINAELNEISCEKVLVNFWESVLGKANTKSSFRTFCLQQNVKKINRWLSENMDMINEGNVTDLRCELNNELQIVHHGTNAVTFGQRSEGEKKKTQLALLFAIFNITSTQSSFKPHFLFLDEIYDSLDDYGRSAIQKWITKFNRLNKSLRTFIITHMELDNTYVGMIKVKKDRKCGSMYSIAGMVDFCKISKD